MLTIKVIKELEVFFSYNYYLKLVNIVKRKLTKICNVQILLNKIKRKTNYFNELEYYIHKKKISNLINNILLVMSYKAYYFEFDKNETASRIDAYVSDAINKFDDPKGRAIATGHVENQIEQLGSLNGIPVNSEQMKSMRQKYMDGIHTGIVGRFSNEGNYVSASNYVAEQDKLGKIDSKTRERLIDFIDTNQKRIGSIDVASKIIAFGNSNSFVMGGYSDIVNPSFSKNVNDLGPQQNAGLKVVYAVNSDQPISSPQDGVVQTIKKQDKNYFLLPISGCLST
jgi:hypothetical protein